MKLSKKISSKYSVKINLFVPTHVRCEKIKRKNIWVDLPGKLQKNVNYPFNTFQILPARNISLMPSALSVRLLRAYQ